MAGRISGLITHQGRMDVKLAAKRSKAIHKKTTLRTDAGGATAHLPGGVQRRRVEARACSERVTPAHVQRDARERIWKRTVFIQLWLLFCLALPLTDLARGGYWTLAIKDGFARWPPPPIHILFIQTC